MKLNKFSIESKDKIIKFHIHSFENLQYISLNIINEITNIKDILPIFNDRCNIIFKKLTYLEFRYNIITSEAKISNSDNLINFYNNIDKIPNLKTFILSISSRGIDEVLYEKLIKKLLLLGLNICELDIQREENFHSSNYYSKEELKQICPNRYFRFENILIQKLKTN